MLKKLLNNVIAEDISHQLQGIRSNLSKDNFLLVTVCRFKFLLYKPRPMLISTKLYNVIIDVLSLLVKTLIWNSRNHRRGGGLP